MITIKSKRTKATSITNKVRKEVMERDSINGTVCCIFCGRPNANQCMHYIPRSANGLGIVENLAMGCEKCHFDLDQSIHRKRMLLQFKLHLMIHHQLWNEKNLVYRKYET